MTPKPTRVLISYAHGDPDEDAAVREFWTLLRREGIDARIDLTAAVERRFWPQWMGEQLEAADYVLVVVSPRYKALAQGRDVPGLGVPWEARQLQEILYARFRDGVRTIVPVVLPRYSRDDIPTWLFPSGATSYPIPELSAEGIDALLRMLTGQPLVEDVPLGTIRTLPPVGTTRQIELEIEAELRDGMLRSAVRLAGEPLGVAATRPLPGNVRTVWRDLAGSPQPAGIALRDAGSALSAAVLDERQLDAVCARITDRIPGEWLDVTVVADDDVLGLPFELLRLGELGPLGLIAGVSVRRRLPGERPARSVPGPLKILVAVAAPDETLTPNPPLDVEAEMQAVLDAVGAAPGGQVRVLEVAAPAEITGALRDDPYHVLHLSAHGSPTGIELEDEDGHPLPVGTGELLAALRDADAHVPLIVLSSCSGAADTGAMAAGLVRAGADRVIAMQTAVSDVYATTLAAELYGELAREPGQPTARALARARRNAEKRPRDADTRPEFGPEFGVAALVGAGPDTGLLDTAAAPVHLRSTPVAPTGTSVRELSLGHLIGRRHEVRTTTGLLRRTPRLVEEHGAISGVQLTGIGGIGKTAVAGRVTTRLRGDGWLVALHTGPWRPAALFAAVATELAKRPAPGPAAAALGSDGVADEAKIELVGQVLRRERLLLVLDDFELNLTVGGQAFVDPAFAEILTEWCAAAEVGAVLVTSRHPLPDDDRHLVQIAVPPLTPSEARRLFLRLPALRKLPVDERLLLGRVIGGHPRLFEYVDALARGRPARLAEVDTKLRALAARVGVDLTRPRAIGAAVEDALVLGSADILLGELLGLLDPLEAEMVDQLSVSRTPMTVAELAAALGRSDDPRPLAQAARRLVGTTLLVPGPDLLIHPWTAEILGRRAGGARTTEHRRAMAVRLRRLEAGTYTVDDLMEYTRHLAALGDFDEIAALARGALHTIGSALVTAAFLAEARALVPAGTASWVTVAKQESDLARAAGRLGAAEGLLEETRRCATAYTDDHPDDDDWAADLSVALIDLADLHLARGRPDAAAVLYREALDRAEKWNARHAARLSPWWRSRPALARERLGELAKVRGDLTAATAHQEAAMAVRRELTGADPVDAERQHDLAVSHNELGRLAMVRDDLAAAAVHYRAGLAIAQRLVAAHPTDLRWQNGLSVSHSGLGDLAAAQGDFATATVHGRAALDIVQRLVAADPTDLQWQNGLSVSHSRLGDLAATDGDLAGADVHFQAALAIAQRLAAADPTDPGWQRSLAISHHKRGQLAAVGGDLATAGTHFDAALTVTQQLAAIDPTNTEWQRDLSVGHLMLGDLAAERGDLETAFFQYLFAVNITGRLSSTDPTNAQWRTDLEIAEQRLDSTRPKRSLFSRLFRR